MPMREQFRARNLAISRKAAYEADFLYATEDDGPEPSKPLKLTTTSQNEKSTLPNSPISVASTFDVPPEIKSFLLPGSWVVVGKGGKPLKNDKMYDEPAVAVPAKKKRKKQRSRKAGVLLEPEPLVEALAETGSSSECLRELHRSTTQRDKQVHRSKDAKRWARYKLAKQLRRTALGELVAALSLADLDEAADAPDRPLPLARPTKDNKANSNKDKARRRARSAAVAARCSYWDAEDELASAFDEHETAKEARPPRVRTARLSGELQLCFGPLVANDEPAPEVELPGAWTTVGKRGKPLSAFPPLAPVDTADTLKVKKAAPAEPSRRKSSEHAPPKPTSKRGSKSAEKSIKCSLM